MSTTGQVAICPAVIAIRHLRGDGRISGTGPGGRVCDVDASGKRRRSVHSPVTGSVTEAAIGAMRKLAERQPRYHRVKLPDALIASCAQDAGLGVLHYDRHYERLARMLHFESRWIAPAGSVT